MVESLKMTCRLIILLISCILRLVCFSYAEFAPVSQPSTCDKPNRNTLVEHFFNTIFTEFYSSPPVCVCVQMCIGQSTYCYPNGCFKSVNTTTSIRNVAEPKESTSPTLMQKNKNNFILVKDERDFMADFLEQNYVDELKDPKTHPSQVLLPDVFKNKNNIVSKYKKTPTVDLRHNLQDKVVRDLAKTESDWTKTRWPLSRQNKRNGASLFSHLEKPIRKQGTYFASMMRDNDVPDYSSKYYKRELAKTNEEDEKKLKSMFNLENLVNMTESRTFPLDKLIENLIRSSITTNVDTTANNNEIAKREEMEIDTQYKTEKTPKINSTARVNETTRIMSINLTNENVEKNKYLEISQENKTANLNQMIKKLANQIDIENNTSMEIAKKAIKGFDPQWYDADKKNNHKETELNNTTSEEIDIKTTLITNTEETSTRQFITTVQTEIETTKSNIKTTSPRENSVTKKNRQKVVKKSGSSKIN